LASRESAGRFERAHGYAPEGKGFLDLIFFGFRVAPLLTVVAWALAVFSYVQWPPPRPRGRRWEAALMGIPVMLTVVLALLWFQDWHHALRTLTGIQIGLSR
jgi:hypothetical protein